MFPGIDTHELFCSEIGEGVMRHEVEGLAEKVEFVVVGYLDLVLQEHVLAIEQLLGNWIVLRVRFGTFC